MGFLVPLRCINRNIVECKEQSQDHSPCLRLVLIETLWNVKWQSNPECITQDTVLIETLWNVKQSKSKISPDSDLY